MLSGTFISFLLRMPNVVSPCTVPITSKRISGELQDLAEQFVGLSRLVACFHWSQNASRLPMLSDGCSPLWPPL